MVKQKISELDLLTSMTGTKYAEVAKSGVSYRTPVRPKYTADTTLYVSPSGNDTTGDGSSGRPFRTPQACYDFLTREVDFGGRIIKMKLRPGTYEASAVGAANTTGLRYTYDWSSPGTDAMAVLLCSANWAGGGHLLIEGDDDDPSNVVFDGLLTGSSGLWNGCGVISDVAASHLIVTGIQFERFSSALYIEGGVQFDLGAANFVGGPSNSNCVNIQDGAYCSNLSGPVTLSGALGNVYSCIFGGRMHTEFYVIVIEAGCTFDNFLVAGCHGTLNFGLHTIGGAGYATATGRPFVAYEGATILVYGNNGNSGYNFEDVLPGNVSGLIETGGNVNGITSHGQRVVKTADELWDIAHGANNAGAAFDAELWFDLPQNTKFWFRMCVWYDTPTAADFKYSVKGPTNATYVRIKHKSRGPGAAASSDHSIETAFNFADVTVTETSGTTGGYIEIEGIVHAGSAPDYSYIEFEWDQAVANASTTTVRAGSYIEYGRA